MRTLVEHRQMVSFFNDIKVSADDVGIPAVEFFGTKGFFPNYDARPTDALDSKTANAWSTGLDHLAVKRLKPDALAARLAKLDLKDAAAMTVAQFVATLKQIKSFRVNQVDAAVVETRLDATHVLTRGDACALMYHLLRQM